MMEMFDVFMLVLTAVVSYYIVGLILTVAVVFLIIVVALILVWDAKRRAKKAQRTITDRWRG